MTSSLRIINNQPAEKPFTSESGSLDVHSIFDTIQGEGPCAGMPATFIRLAGCNLECAGCDTLYTDGRRILTPEALAARLDALPKRQLIVLTGGEPYRQALGRAILHLCSTGRQVQIETNGTLYQNVTEWVPEQMVKVVCSPKTPKVHPEMWKSIAALKYVVEAGYIDPLDGLPTRSVGTQYGRPSRPPLDWKGEIYVQPLDVQRDKKNQENLRAAVESCMKYGYRLCLQTQKLIGLP